MSGTDWYFLAWKRAFDIRGRSRRKEFAYFFIPVVLAIFALLGFGNAFGGDEGGTVTPSRVLMGLLLAAIIVPRTTLIIRRLHDLGMGGWLALLSLVPYAGLVMDAFCLIADTNPRPNKWGVSPKFTEAQRWMTSLQRKQTSCEQ